MEINPNCDISNIDLQWHKNHFLLFLTIMMTYRS